MSELFRVRVHSVTGPKVVLDVTPVHPDSGAPVPSATFAMMLLVEGAAAAGRKTTPLLSVVDEKRVYDPKWVRENARAFVEDVGAAGDRLTVKATDPAWTAHLQAGRKWSSVAWDAGPGKRAAPAHPPAKATGSGKDLEGFEKAKFPKVPAGCVKHGLVPTLPVGRYEADPVVRELAKMESAVKKWVGRPVLIRRKRKTPEIVVPVQKPKWTTSQVTAKKAPTGKPPGLFYSELVRAYVWNVKRLTFVCVRASKLNAYDTIDCADLESLGLATLR